MKDVNAEYKNRGWATNNMTATEYYVVKKEAILKRNMRVYELLIGWMQAII